MLLYLALSEDEHLHHKNNVLIKKKKDLSLFQLKKNKIIAGEGILPCGYGLSLSGLIRYSYVVAY